MKNTLLLVAALGLFAVAGCSQNSADQTPPADTNSTTQNAEQSASNAWQDTKSAATNVGAAIESGATNAWNKTTNAVEGSSTNQ